MNLNALCEYANPLKFIRTTERALPYFAVAAFVCLLGGLVWGFFFTPDDYRQGSGSALSRGCRCCSPSNSRPTAGRYET